MENIKDALNKRGMERLMGGIFRSEITKIGDYLKRISDNSYMRWRIDRMEESKLDLWL